LITVQCELTRLSWVKIIISIYLDEFFERPDITYINSGRKDHVIPGQS